jgi:adenylate cyclase
VTALSNVPKLIVIARNSTFTYKGKPVKVQQISEELGVRYVLEGSVRKSGDEIRITAQLVDAINGHHLWAQRYDGNLSNIFAVQEEITKKIISALQVKLTEGEEVRIAAKGTSNLQAYLKYLQANELFYKHTPEDCAMARKLAEEAVALDPRYASAYYVQSKTHILDMWFGTTTSPEASMAKAKQLLQKAIDLNDAYADAHAFLGWLFAMTGQYDDALAHGEKAVALNPNSAESHMRYGKILTQAGKNKESISELQTAIRLNPIPPNVYLYSLGLAYCFDGQYDQAIKWCERAVREEPNAMFARLFLALTYSLSGRDEEAQIEVAEVLRIYPKFSLEKFAKRCAQKDKTQCERVVSALRKAGLK